MHISLWSTALQLWELLWLWIVCVWRGAGGRGVCDYNKAVRYCSFSFFSPDITAKREVKNIPKPYPLKGSHCYGIYNMIFSVHSNGPIFRTRLNTLEFHKYTTSEAAFVALLLSICLLYPHAVSEVMGLTVPPNLAHSRGGLSQFLVHRMGRLNM